MNIKNKLDSIESGLRPQVRRRPIMPRIVFVAPWKYPGEAAEDGWILYDPEIGPPELEENPAVTYILYNRIK